MPKIIVEKPFPFAIDGNQIVEIATGEQEVSDRCALVAVEHLKVATLVGQEKPKPKAKAGGRE